MQNPILGIVNVLGRVLLTAIFLASALGNKIPKFNNVANYMASEGVPAPKIMLAGAIVFLIVGGLSIILGYKARIGATLLLVFLVLATYFFHDFWNVGKDVMWILNVNPEVEMPKQLVENINFMKNLGLMGAMLMIIANGSGPMSLDNRSARPKDEPSSP